MKFTVVTPCRNAERFISDTVSSLARQSALLRADSRHELEYIVVDGGSSDHTVRAAREAWTDASRATLTVVSEPDKGMYDALVKGFNLASGDVVSYLNAGDYYAQDCLDIVATAFESPEVDWLTGMWVVYTRAGGIFGAKVPWSYNRALIRRGYHGIRGRGAHIQQESTFWRRNLLGVLDLDELSKLRYAGDLYLWVRFAENYELYVAAAHLGGFRYHGDHMSDARESYVRESLDFIGGPVPWGPPVAIGHRIAGYIPTSARVRLRMARRLFTYSPASDKWQLH